MLRTHPIDIGTGIVGLYSQRLAVLKAPSPIPPRFAVPFLSISASLNVLLTLMIVVQLVPHASAATGPAVGTSKLNKAACTMLIRSCALFTVNSFVVVAALALAAYADWSGSYLAGIFFPILAEIQVRAFLRPQSPGQLSNVAMYRTGDRSAARHSTDC